MAIDFSSKQTLRSAACFWLGLSFTASSEQRASYMVALAARVCLRKGFLKHEAFLSISDECCTVRA